MQAMSDSRLQVQQEFLKTKTAVREAEAAIVQDRAMLEEAMRHIETSERLIQSQNLKLS